MEKYSLVDMHLHSHFSNEKGVTNSPGDLIDMAVRNAVDDRRVAISITDHNNIRATNVALQYIEDNSLKNKVHYIPGAEFNTGAKSLGVFSFNGKRKSVFGSIHLLGYNFDHTNEEIEAFTFLRNFNYAGANVGDQVCATRNLIKQETGVAIPFKYLKSVVGEIYSSEDFFNKLVKRILNYGNLVGEPFPQSYVSACAETYLTKEFKHNADAVGKAKLDIEDMSHLIKSAGGICVVAHPTYITYKQKAILHSVNALDEFLSVANDKKHLIDGMEFFYPAMSNFKEFPQFYDLAGKHNLFLTAGSDFHGFQDKYQRVIGKVFDVQIKGSKSQFFGSRQIVNRVVYLPIVDYLNGKNEFDLKNQFLVEITEKGELKNKKAIIEMFEMQQKEKANQKSSIEDRFKPQMDSKKLDLLNALKTLQKVYTLSVEASDLNTKPNRQFEICSQLRAILSTGFYSVLATNKHFNHFNFVKNNLDDFKHFVVLVGLVKSTFEILQDISKEFKLENRDIIKAIENLHIKYAHNILPDKHILPEVEVIQGENGAVVKIKDEELLNSSGLTEEDLTSKDVQQPEKMLKSSTALKKSLKALGKIETLYTVVVKDGIPENIKADSFEELKNILNSSISAINTTIINFYSVQYIEENRKEFREFVDYITSIRGLSEEIEERNLPYTTNNTKILEVFKSFNLEELQMSKQK